MPVPERAVFGEVTVLVTGAGGPAGVAMLRSLSADPTVRLVAADMDGWAAGLYLVDAADRLIIPPGSAPEFAQVLLAASQATGAEVVIPTVDAELRPLAAARADFERAGISLMLPPAGALNLALDKLALARACAGVVRVPRTECLTEELDADSWDYPVIVKPRTGSGSRDISVIGSAPELTAFGPSPEFIVQDYLPGEEYSIDVLADTDGRVVAGVPRARARVDSGISVAGRTLHDPELEEFGAAVAERVGLTFIANVQARRDRAGRPALLEVNPRPPGSLPLTVASGVDMPRLALDALRGRPMPDHASFCEKAMVRFLDERFFDPAEVAQSAQSAHNPA